MRRTALAVASLAFCAAPAFAADHVVLAKNGPGGRHFEPSPLTIAARAMLAWPESRTLSCNRPSTYGVVRPLFPQIGIDSQPAAFNGLGPSLDR